LLKKSLESIHITKKCEICGKRINRVAAANEEPLVYCSFKCSLVGRRKFYLIMSIICLLIAIITQIVNHFKEQLIEALIVFLMFYVIFVLLFILAISGFLIHKRGIVYLNSDVSGVELILSKKIKIKPFEYSKNNKIDVCMICKLAIRISDYVYQCPECNSYFHQQHLDDWLEKKSTCPVCGCLLVKLNSKND